MTLNTFTQKNINECNCYENGEFLIVQNFSGKWNAYKNGASIKKIVLRQDDDGQGNPINVIGAKEYDTAEDAVLDCV